MIWSDMIWYYIVLYYSILHYIILYDIIRMHAAQTTSWYNVLIRETDGIIAKLSRSIHTHAYGCAAQKSDQVKFVKSA